MPHQLRPLDTSTGMSEPQLHPHGGLRVSHYSTILTSSTAALISAQAVPATANFTPLTLAGTRVPFPSTLVAQVVQGVPVPATIRLEINGRDQYGMPQRELTPTINLVAKTNNHIYLAKVFSSISRVRYVSTVLGGGDTINLGVRYDWDPTTDINNEHLHRANLGVALFRWTRDHAQGVLNPARNKFALYDSIPAAELPKVSYYNITAAALIGTIVPVIGLADGADWESSLDKWAAPPPPAVLNQPWAVGNVVEVQVFQATRLIGFSR